MHSSFVAVVLLHAIVVVLLHMTVVVQEALPVSFVATYYYYYYYYSGRLTTMTQIKTPSHLRAPQVLRLEPLEL
jgi:hypothetical protein